MTSYTVPYSLPTIDAATDPIKDASSPSALADDLNALAQAVNLALGSVSPFKGPLNTGADMDTETSAKAFTIPTGTLWDSILHLPSIGSSAGWGWVEQTSNGLTRQVINTYGTDPQTWERVTVSAVSGLFGDWRRTDADKFTTPYAGAGNIARLSEFTFKRGGIKDTAGLGAVAFRYDHGLANLKTKAYPLHSARNIPFSVAINSGAWALAENTGCTISDVQGWVTAGLAELWNHGKNHSDATSFKTLEDTIAGGLAELQSQFPTAYIPGFVVPGVGGTGYAGFSGGVTPEAFYNTMAGRLILQHHAVATGAFAGTSQRVLDGYVRQGQGHYSIEAQTVAQIKAQIDLAKTNKTGLQIMMHPSLLDTAGYLTTAQLTEVLDYVAAERTAGRLAVLSPYDLLLADSRTATNSRLAGIDTRVTALESIKAFRGLVPNGSDVSTWKTSAYNGWWLISTGTQAASITGLPPGVAVPVGILFNNASDNGIHFQKFSTYGTGVYGSYEHENTGFNTGLWNPWRKIATNEDWAGTVIGNVNLSTITTPGVYYPGTGSSVTTANGYPPGAVGLVGSLLVENWTNSGQVNRIQTYKPWSSNKFYIRHVYQGTPEASWAEYEDGPTLRAYTDQQVVATPAIHQHDMRVNDLKHRLGPVKTGGKGAVALVFDHGTNNFKDVVLPLLTARGFRATLALNSDMYNPAAPRYATDNATTWAMVKGWHDANGIEIANHGRTHTGPSAYSDIVHEVKDGRTELETNLPGVVIDSWVQTGNTQPSFGGFNDGNTLAAYWSTEAGRVILDNHAVVTGLVPGTRLYPLMSDPIVGMQGGWIDTGAASITSVQGAITTAGAQGRGYLVRCHPELLNTGSNTTTAELSAFLDWLAAKTDIVVLPLRELAIAVS